MEQYNLSPLLSHREKVFALLFPHISKGSTRPLSHCLYPGYKSGLRTPVQCWFSLELAHRSNSVSRSNKLYFPLILSHIWKFFSNLHLDHDTLNCKIKPANPKGNQSWIFIGRTYVEAPRLWPPDAKNWLTGKDPDAGKDRRQEEKRMTEDEMVGWHYQLDGHEFEQALGVGDGHGSLECCSSWGHKESDTTEQLNWTENLKP